jgi:hypothetical protein
VPYSVRRLLFAKIAYSSTKMSGAYSPGRNGKRESYQKKRIIGFFYDDSQTASGTC